MQRRILKWGLRLLLLAIVLVVISILSLDTLLRLTVEHNIRKQTGMTAEIGKFHFGLIEPVVEIKNLQLYNSAEFGGAPFLTIPEIHVEYDRDAFALKNEIHLTLLRFNLGELDIVKGQDGQTNIFSLGLELPGKKIVAGPGGSQPLAEIKKQTGKEFKGIDCLEVSVGTFKYLDLQDQKNNREQKIGIENCVITNVVSGADLVGLGVLVGLRSDTFFKSLVAPDDSTSSAQDLLKLLRH